MGCFSFHEASKSIYTLQIQAVGQLVSVQVAENAAMDVAGNPNLASDRLQVRHCMYEHLLCFTHSYTDTRSLGRAGSRALDELVLLLLHADSVPASSSWIAAITTVVFLTTAAVAALLTVSTSSLVAAGAVSRPSSYMISEPSRNVLVRSTCTRRRRRWPYTAHLVTDPL